MPGVHRRYATNRYYTINVGDGLIHRAFVKNTTRGPWFSAFCYMDKKEGDPIRGAIEPCEDVATCLECLEKDY
jgi:hypothetical protein